MKKTSRQIALGQVCECSQQCLGKICQASDSGLTAQKCWCADCADYRAEAKANAYRWRVEVTANGYRTHRFNIDDFNEDGTRTLEN